MYMNSLLPVTCSQSSSQNESEASEVENLDARDPTINSIASPVISSNLRRKRGPEEKYLEDGPANKRRRLAYHNIHNEFHQIHYQEIHENHPSLSNLQNQDDPNYAPYQNPPNIVSDDNRGPNEMLIDNDPFSNGNPNLKRKWPEEKWPDQRPLRRRRTNHSTQIQSPFPQHPVQEHRHPRPHPIAPSRQPSSPTKSSRSSSPPAVERDPFLGSSLSLEDRACRVSPAQSREFDEKFTVHGKDIDFKHPTSDVSALFLYPRNDHNNAFRLNDHLKYRLLALSKHYNVKVRYIHDIDEAADLISDSKDGEIHHLVLGGHGSASSITFGHGGGRAKLTTETEVDSKLFEKLAPKATILLDSCSAGLRLAEYVANLAPGRHVYGSEVTLYSSMILIDSIFPYRCTISEHGHDRTAITVC